MLDPVSKMGGVSHKSTTGVGDTSEYRLGEGQLTSNLLVPGNPSP